MATSLIRLILQAARFSGLLLLPLCLALLGTSTPSQSSAPAKTASPQQSESSSVSAKAPSGSQPGQPTAPKPATAAYLAALPEPLPATLTQGIDVNERSKAILEHLSEIIRFYRMTATPIQKIGEPSDVLYAEQSQTAATQIAQLAFQSARDQAALLARIQVVPGKEASPTTQVEAQRLRASQLRVQQQIQDLQQRADDLTGQLGKAPRKARATLQQELDITKGQLQLARAESEALIKVSGVSASQTNSGLQADIDKLQHAIPEVIDAKIKPVAATVESVSSVHASGVITQGQALFQLLSTERAIEERIAELKKLHNQAAELRTPLVNILKATLEQGRKLQSATGANDSSGGASGSSSSPETATQNADIRKQYDQLTDAFKTISGVSIPISQEILVLEQAQGNLLSWRAAVDTEETSIVHALLLRVVIIAVALVLVFGIGELWRRAATRYVQDIRHRRQLLVVRRMVIGFMSGLVLIFGFVTQFSSMATFAGLITAGIAVCLQTVLLSIAAYFFIIGRYGVRVGERISVAGVTGEVIDVSLVRFYLMELAGNGAQLHSTGRIAVFANSVLFQTGTPLYKQIPGTNYVWHSIALKLKPEADYQAAIREVRAAMEGVYKGYKDEMERQHADTELWMDTTIPKPRLEEKMEFSDGLRYVVLFPVPLSDAANVDQRYVQSVLDLINRNPKVADAIDGAPGLEAVAKT